MFLTSLGHCFTTGAKIFNVSRHMASDEGKQPVSIIWSPILFTWKRSLFAAVAHAEIRTRTKNANRFIEPSHPIFYDVISKTEIVVQRITRFVNYDTVQ